MIEKQDTSFLLNLKIYWQIIIGTVCGGLTYLVKLFAVHFNIPLFVDTMFTIFASFFGWWSGMISAVIFHIAASVPYFQPTGFLFSLCSITVVCIVRLFLKNSKKPDFIEFLGIYFAIVILISLEGGIISSILSYATESFTDDSSISSTMKVLLHQKTPFLLSAFLSRIPNNLVDKAINLGISLLMFFLYKKKGC